MKISSVQLMIFIVQTIVAIATTPERMNITISQFDTNIDELTINYNDFNETIEVNGRTAETVIDDRNENGVAINQTEIRPINDHVRNDHVLTKQQIRIPQKRSFFGLLIIPCWFKTLHFPGIFFFLFVFTFHNFH